MNSDCIWMSLCQITFNEIINNQNNWEICCWPADVPSAGMRSCAIAVHFRPRGFALPLLVA